MSERLSPAAWASRMNRIRSAEEGSYSRYPFRERPGSATNPSCS